MEPDIRKGVHNLRHTFGRRLRGAGVPLEILRALIGHANGDITIHYSAAELGELLQAAEKIMDRGLTQSQRLRWSGAAPKRMSEKCRKTKKG